MRFYPSAYSAGMWCDPRLLQRDEDLIKNMLRPGDTFIDVGANVGCLTLAAWTAIGGEGRLFSIEAHPKTVQYLRGNVLLNEATNIQVIHCAAGDSTGEISLSNRRSDDQNQVTAVGIRVPLRRLDDIIPWIPIRVMKIDVEGYELFVLKGAQKLLQQTDYIYFESWDQHFRKYGYGSSDVISFLRKSGFTVDLPEGHVSHKLENIVASRHT